MSEHDDEEFLKAIESQLSRCRAELEAERARWRSLVEGIADEVWVCDAQARVTLRNVNAADAMGLRELVDRPLDEIFAEVEILHPDGRVRPPEESPLLRSLRGEVVRGDEIMRHRGTGVERHRRFGSAPIRDASGTITGAIAIVHDITDAKTVGRRNEQINSGLVKRAAELKSTLMHHAMELASMARLQEISMRLVRQDDPRLIHEEVLDAAIGITGADKGTIQMAGGSGRMEIVAQTGFETASLGTLNEIQGILAAGDSPLKKGERLVIEDLARHPWPRGSPGADFMSRAGIHAMQLTPLIGHTGGMVGLVATHYLNRRRPDEYSLRLLDMLARHATEIMMRRRAEAALRDSEAAMKAFFDRATVGAAMLDPDGHFVFVNDCYCRISGYGREDLLAGMTPVELTPVQERAMVREALMPFLRGEIPEYDIEHRLVRKDGGEIWVRATAGLIRDEAGRPRRLAAVIQDISERKKAEEALRGSRRQLEAVNQTLEQRVAERTAEAEARTAQLRKLAAELTRTEQRERRRFAQMLHDHLQQLLVGAKFNASILDRRLTDPDVRRYLGYVIDLLDQSIAASRSLTIELSPPILFEGKLVPSLQWLARWMQENHGLNVTIGSSEEVYPIDPDTRVLLFQCVRELLLNIVKHAGVKEAQIRLKRIDGSIHIEVEDKGVGFDPASLKIGAGGFSGLGLLNIQERLILHGGRLEIESAAGAGTRMRLTAPMQASKIEEPAEEARAAEAPAPVANQTGRIRVLIADDHAAVRDGLSRVLQSDPNVEVIGAAVDGEQAIELANQLRPDVVLMDVSMPGISGIEATRRLHHATSIIGLSIHAETDMAARMREAGAVDYLVKTAPPEEVIDAIHRAAHK